MARCNTLFVVLGNQLFPPALLKDHENATFYLAEDLGLCTYVKHHKQKILLFLAAMRSYRDELQRRDFQVHYETLDHTPPPASEPSYTEKLAAWMETRSFDRLVMWEIEDKFFEQQIETFAQDQGLDLTFLESPMFVTPRETFEAYLDAARSPFMASFYEKQRKRLNVLIDTDGKPTGGQWSFDAENRKPLPKDVDIPTTRWPEPTEHVADVIRLIGCRFADHPGELPEDGKFWLPTTRSQALAWLRAFLKQRFVLFGDYEDALSTRDPILFHSALSPTLNLGLITPQEVLDRALEHAQKYEIPLNALEGFVRQLIGWREFVRGIYREYSHKQEQANRWNAQRSLTQAWWTGDTGIPPLDDAIHKALKYGWNHHIERLMVVGNLMNLCEIKPRQAHDWYMAMYVDSSDWVMGPNVYGMALTSDGGIFATKPYICGSNYLLKMSDYRKPKPSKSKPLLTGNHAPDFGDATWADVVDGLYWRFVNKHRDALHQNVRMRQMVSTFDRMSDERKSHILPAAQTFLEQVTTT